MSTLLLIVAIIYCVYKIIKSRGNFAFNKATKLINQGNYDDGLKQLDKAVALGVSPMHRVRAAFAELKFGDIDKVPKKINLILMDTSVKPNVKNEARCVMAIYHIMKNNLNEAKEIMEKVHENFKCTRFYQTYGYLAYLTGDDEFCKNANEEAYEYNSTDSVICDNYCMYLMKEKRFSEAVSIYEKALETERNFPEIYYNYAVSLIETGNKEKAKEMLEKALTKPFFNNTTVKKEAVEALYRSI